MQVSKSKHGTYLTPDELIWRKELIDFWICCPITNEVLNALDGEVFFIDGKDCFISNNGIDKLKEIFGEKFIMERKITYD